MDWRGWFVDNWFSLVQSGGIIGGLVFTGWSLRRSSLDARIGNTLGLAQQHRDLWGDAHRRPELARILEGEVDLVSHPVTVTEREYLDLAIYHFYTCYELGSECGLISLDVLALDARSFFAKPIPQAVWRETRASRAPAFVRFIENAVAG